MFNFPQPVFLQVHCGRGYRNSGEQIWYPAGAYGTAAYAAQDIVILGIGREAKLKSPAYTGPTQDVLKPFPIPSVNKLLCVRAEDAFMSSV